MKDGLDWTDKKIDKNCKNFMHQNVAPEALPGSATIGWQSTITGLERWTGMVKWSGGIANSVRMMSKGNNAVPFQCLVQEKGIQVDGSMN